LSAEVATSATEHFERASVEWLHYLNDVQQHELIPPRAFRNASPLEDEPALPMRGRGDCHQTTGEGGNHGRERRQLGSGALTNTSWTTDSRKGFIPKFGRQQCFILSAPSGEI